MLTGHPETKQQQWIPILDYAVLKGVSTSTLRRYIKAKKIQYKVENGRYLLLADAKTAQAYAEQTSQPQQRMVRPNWDGYNPPAATSEPVQAVSTLARVCELEEKLVQAEEQISELKMLVAIYEEKLAQLER